MTSTLHSVFVTGAGGFIGRGVVKNLLQEGHKVSALLMPNEAEPVSWQGQVNVVRGDICDAAKVKQWLSGHDTVIHLAAMVGDWGAEEMHQRVTVGGTRNILDAVLSADAHLVLASSICVYGRHFGQGKLVESLSIGEDMLSPYDKSKTAQENLLQEYAKQNALSFAIVRPGNVFGPASGPWVLTMLEEIKRGSPMLIDGGELDAGLAYVDNVVDVLLLAAFHPAAKGQIFNAADAQGISWYRYLNDLAKLAGLPPPKRINGLLATIIANGGEFIWKLAKLKNRPPLTRISLRLLGKSTIVDISKAEGELGYRPAVNYEQAMQNIADWFNKNKSGKA